MATNKAAATKDGRASKQGAPAAISRGATDTVKEVSKSERTLLEAIAAGEVPKPEPLSYNAWLTWRKWQGKRPVTKTDGCVTTSAYESTLRKTVLQDARPFIYAYDGLGDRLFNEAAGHKSRVSFQAGSAVI